MGPFTLSGSALASFLSPRSLQGIYLHRFVRNTRKCSILTPVPKCFEKVASSNFTLVFPTVRKYSKDFQGTQKNHSWAFSLSSLAKFIYPPVSWLNLPICRDLPKSSSMNSLHWRFIEMNLHSEVIADPRKRRFGYLVQSRTVRKADQPENTYESCPEGPRWFASLRWWRRLELRLIVWVVVFGGAPVRLNASLSYGAGNCLL